MKKLFKISDDQLTKIVNDYLSEGLFTTMSMDNEISQRIATEDKKIIYDLIKNGDMDGVVDKIKKMTEEMSSTKFGEGKESYIKDFLKRMAKAMMYQKYDIK